LDNSKVAVVLNFTAEKKPLAAPTAEELGLDGRDFKLVPIMSTHSGKEQPGVLLPFEGRVYLVN
jgi:alpha-glucosidase